MTEGPKTWAPKNNTEEQGPDQANLEKTASVEQEPRLPRPGESLIIIPKGGKRTSADIIVLTKGLEIGGTLTYDGGEKIGHISEMKPSDYTKYGGESPVQANTFAWDITLTDFMLKKVTYRLIQDTEYNRFAIFPSE